MAGQSILPNVDVPPRRGAAAVVVLQLQQMLNRYGAGLVEDGVYGPATEAAVYRAYDRIAKGPSFEARNLVASGPSAAATVGDLWNTLTLAFDAFAPSLQAPSTPPQPVAPPTTISMGPREAQQMGREIGVLPQPGLPTLGKVLIGLGIAGVVGGIALAIARR
jgi:peptidoglycan hydrolase-like protein with peptidoglycan-binding domain